MGRLILVVVGVLAVVNGIGILTADDCSTVSFDGQAGGRVMTAVCFPDSSGAMSASLAGGGMVVLGVIAVLIVLASLFM